MRNAAKNRLWMFALEGVLAIAVACDSTGAIGAIGAANDKTGVATDAAPAPERITPDELGFDEIIFVKRKPYSSDHYHTDINNGTSPDRFHPKNGIYILNLRSQSERAVITAADLPGGSGLIGKISLSFDGKFGRQHPRWVKPDPAVPAYDPADFRRKATFE